MTLREPVARMYSYFSMQLRFGWSPINHMGKNPCMQRRLRALLQSKEQRHAAALLLAGGSGASSRSAGNGRRLAQTRAATANPATPRCVSLPKRSW